MTSTETAIGTESMTSAEIDLRTFAATHVRVEDEFTGARFPGYRVAAIVPCYNEEAAIGKVVRDLRSTVPGMEIYVYDNRSSDATAEVARKAGAIVRRENLKGKGNVVRRAFADIDADIYLMIDGDDTYDAAAAPAMIQALIDGPHDHVLGIREPETTGEDAYRPGHENGNRMLNAVVGKVFGTNVEDMLSGYRVFSRRFVKSFPAASREFEIETELTVHCLSTRVPTTSVKVGFRDRPAGSESKLRTYRDGFKILSLIVNLARHERPVPFYGAFAALLALLGGVTAPLGIAYATPALFTLAALSTMIGLVLDGTRKTRYEAGRLAYLGQAPVEVRPELLIEDAVTGAAAARRAAFGRSVFEAA
ncbi:Glycosyltransferase involved in cell wall bisynthesis [Jatrophihabitans endophyticus]|uniref:Glycosyltransferase involved in cell wall bisynthesis n=1 Tax=Jatrophihabitans endophyticus TaxID=1206085 RepID=A0A1M5C398_9ACTN|nr:glycosyltransferase [Jatrophihabitans endophyticus]SHF49171.1 Glycosyltransferase involved in cell wall bisynthesis [Jatrophihabitans endophyticus]